MMIQAMVAVSSCPKPDAVGRPCCCPAPKPRSSAAFGSARSTVSHVGKFGSSRASTPASLNAQPVVMPGRLEGGGPDVLVDLHLLKHISRLETVTTRFGSP